LVGTALVAAVPAAAASALAAPAAVAALLRRLSLGRGGGLLGLRRGPIAAVGTAAAVTTVAAAGLTPTAAIPAARRRLRLLLRLLLRRGLGLLLLLAPAAAVAAPAGARPALAALAIDALGAILSQARAGGVRRDAAQQGQNHSRRDQTFHCFPSAPRGLASALSLIPCKQCRPCSMNRV